MHDDLFRRLANVTHDNPHTNVAGQTYTGTIHNDTKAGTDDDDTFNYWQGGTDTLSGNGGADTFNLRDAFDASDTIDGGTGNDTLTLKGDYTQTLTLGPTSLTSVETIRLLGGPGFSLAFDDANIAAGTQLEINAHLLGGGSTLLVDGHNETNGGFIIDGTAGVGDYILGAGNDVVYGGKGDEQIDPGSGTELIVGGDGDDFVGFRPGALDATDYVNGGSGYDEVAEILQADQTVAMQSQTIAYVELFMLTAAADSGEIHVSFTMADGNVSAHKTLDVNLFEGLNAKMDLTLDASAETDGSYNVTAGSGDDTVTGGAKDDVITTGAGRDHAYGGNGDDVFYAGSDFSLNETMDGGAGFDIVHLSGAYSSLGIYNSMLPGTEKLVFDSDADITMGFVAGALPDNGALIVDASVIGATHHLHFDASLVATASLTVTAGGGDDEVRLGGGDDTAYGGAGSDQVYDGSGGDDVIAAGAGDDFLAGGLGRDTITPGAGHDDIIYGGVDQSTGKSYDEIVGFDPREDLFLVPTSPAATGIDARIVGGALSRGSMNADLAAAVDAAHLHANHAVLFAPNAGGLAGKLFLIVDSNGVAGYQTNQDMVILLTDSTHIAQLHADNFQVS